MCKERSEIFNNTLILDSGIIICIRSLKYAILLKGIAYYVLIPNKTSGLRHSCVFHFDHYYYCCSSCRGERRTFYLYIKYYLFIYLLFLPTHLYQCKRYRGFSENPDTLPMFLELCPVCSPKCRFKYMHMEPC